MDELKGLIALVQRGASQDEIRAYMKDNLQALIELPVGEYGDAIRQAGLTSQESGNLNKAYQSTVVPASPGQGLIGQTGLLGAGAGIRGVGGKAVSVTSGETFTKLAGGGSLLSPHLLRSIGTVLGSTWGKRFLGGSLAGAGVFAFLEGSGIIDVMPDDAPADGPIPGAGAATPSSTTSTIPGPSPTGEVVDPNAPLSSIGDPGPTRQRFGPQAPSGGVSTGAPPSPLSDDILPADPGFNIMVIDHTGELTGTPGAVAVITSAMIQQATGGIDPTLAASLATTVGATGGDAATFLSDILAQTPGGASTAEREVLSVMFPESIGEVGIQTPFQVFPSKGVRAEGGFRQPGSGTDTRTEARKAFERQIPEADRLEQGPAPKVGVPAGAQLAPRIFQDHQGRTLMEWADLTARRYGIPLNILYGLVAHESGWKTTAIGRDGKDLGLGQIRAELWGVTREQAFNPVFNLEWTANKLRERYNQYGSWTVAVAAHNSPKAAQFLNDNGKFMDNKSQEYVSSVLGKANNSGLSDFIFDTGADLPGAAATGPKFTPFQAPDPAESREFILGVFEDMLGRKPTEEEQKKGVAKILELSRSSYDADLTQLKGGTSEAVDVGARFQESVRETGEFAFHESVGETNDFTDFAAQVAQMLQQGI